MKTKWNEKFEDSQTNHRHQEKAQWQSSNGRRIRRRRLRWASAEGDWPSKVSSTRRYRRSADPTRPPWSSSRTAEAPSASTPSSPQPHSHPPPSTPPPPCPAASAAPPWAATEAWEPPAPRRPQPTTPTRSETLAPDLAPLSTTQKTTATPSPSSTTSTKRKKTKTRGRDSPRVLHCRSSERGGRSPKVASSLIPKTLWEYGSEI